MVLAIALIKGTHSAQAQNANSGELKGTVTDSTNAIVPGATIKLLNVATGVVMTSETNSAGIYDVPSVPPGDYTVTVLKAGFRDSVRTGITVHVGTEALDATLEVGIASQEIVVNADASLVQTEESGQRMDFDTKAVQDAPTVGGVWYNELTNVLPGVNGGGTQDASGQGVGINGTQGFSASFLLEGSTATQPRDANASNNYPPIDAIGEVNVNTANYGAQYGNGVASFNVLLKSGTNRFHGSAFEFIQNDAFNARNYFNTGKAAPLRWNMYGGSLGGPIIKDKLFFYFTYQRNPNTSSGVYTTTVPTQGASGLEAGVFSTTIINPTTGLPFANNTIPTSMLDPVALNIQKYFPAPNLPGLVNNYRVVQTNPSSSEWYIGKVDWNVTKSHRLSGSYELFPVKLVNSIDAFCSLGFDCTQGNNYNEVAQVTDTWTISPTMVNEVRIGGVREVDKYVPASFGKGYPTTIGLQPAYGPNSPADIFPNITINSGGSVGAIGIGGGTHADLADGSLVESDVFTLIKGKHTIKIGGEFDKNYQNYTNWGDVSSGNFQFNGVSTGVPYADFLLGDVYGWFVYDYTETGARSKSIGAFVQDDYKVLPHLTLNIGLRYQFQGGWGEVQNRWGTFSPDVVNTGAGLKPNTLGAILYGGQDGRNLIQDSANELAPRVGFSWSPRPNWALRGSYGIFDTPWSTDPYTNAYGLGLNPRGSAGYGSTAAFQLKTGPAPGSVVYPTLANLSNSQFNYQNVDYYPVSRSVSYYQEALFSLQHQIPGQILLDASYVFTKGTHQNFARDVNQVPVGSLLSTGVNTAAQPFPQFNSIQGHLFDGYSNYNALQLRAEKRTSHGLSFVVNYAFSKTMDAGTSSGHSAGVDVWQDANNVAANYGLSQLDTRHTLNGSATYDLPFGKGRMFALNGPVNEVLGGWRLTGIFQVHSGIPFTPTIGSADLSNSGANQCSCGFAWLPNVVGNAAVTNPSTTEWFNTAAFATPASGTFGTERRNTLEGPSWRDLDLSLGKGFQLREGVKLEIRADTFDILNHPNFAQPNASVGAGVVGGGQITTANTSRQVQLGGRFSF
jgi:outer membrane receptor protein involved in Fe transport